MTVPFLTGHQKLLFVLRIDNSVIALFIDSTAEFIRNYFKLTGYNCKFLSLQNQFELSPFAFRNYPLASFNSRFIKCNASSVNSMEMDNFFTIKSSSNDIVLKETQINQHLFTHSHPPSMFFSSNKQPVSSHKAKVIEYAFYSLN